MAEIDGGLCHSWHALVDLERSASTTSVWIRRLRALKTSQSTVSRSTVNSGSVTTEFDRLSRAGAAGRIALIEAGAKVLSVKESDCTASNSRVIDGVSGRSISYGEIIQQVKIDRKFAYPDDFKAIKLKTPGTYSIIGKSIPALDIPAKTNGQAKYGIDVFLPNMVYGVVDRIL